MEHETDTQTPVATRPVTPRLAAGVVYLWVIVALGLAVLAANPPFQAPDEYEHFFRIIQISQGEWIGVKRGNEAGGEIPNAAHTIASPGTLPGHGENKASSRYYAEKAQPWFMNWSHAAPIFAAFPHTFYYSPLGYAPQAIAVTIAKAAHLGPLLVFYIARLAAFATCAAFGYFAITATRVYAWTTTLFLLSPTALYMAGSLAPDGLLIFGSVLLVRLLLRARLEGRVSRGALAMILGLGALLPVAKFVYLPVSALIPLLLWTRGKGPRRVALWTAACVVPVVVWSLVIARHYVVGRTDIPVDPPAQIQHIVAHPLEFGLVVLRSVTDSPGYLCRTLIGVLGWNDCPLPAWFYWVFGIGFVGCAVVESSRAGVVTGTTRAWLVLAAAAAVLAVYFAMYVHWTRPHDRTVDGIVGRYLLPALAPLTCSLPAVAGARVSAIPVSVLGTALAVVSGLTCFGAVLFRYFAL